MFSKIDFGNGLGRWKTIPTRRRNSVTSLSRMFSPSSVISPSMRVFRSGLVDPVQIAQKRRFATARRADQRRDAIGFEAEVDVVQRLKIAVEKIDVRRFHFRHRRWRHRGAGFC